MKWGNQQEAALANAKQLLKHEQDSTELLKLISNKWKLIKIEKKKKKNQKLEEKLVALDNQLNYWYPIKVLDDFTFLWLPQGYDKHHLTWFNDFHLDSWSWAIINNWETELLHKDL